MNGVACNLESRGFKALCKATEEIEPYSITGSLPLIRELQVCENQCSLNS
jgi:acetylornithine deacetylase